MAVERSAKGLEERGARPPDPPDGPRFALRFEGGHGRLSLARPHRFAWGRVEALELSLGRLRFPLDLSAGARRFRSRRTEVSSAEVRIDLARCVAAIEEEPFRLDLLAERSAGVEVALHDALGVVATSASVRSSGADVEIVLSDARSATEGPAPPLARALMTASGLGLPRDGAVLHVRRALGVALREALVPWGWRMPDDRGVSLSIEWLSARRVVLRAGATSAPTTESREQAERFESARRLGPVVAALTRADRADAERLWHAEVERGARESAALRSMARGLGVEPAASDDVSALVREALRSGDAEAAGARALDLDAREPCDAVAIEALCEAADLAVGDHPPLATRLLERAAARRPGDTRIALRLLELHSRRDDEEALDEALASALRALEPGLSRARFARSAATVCALSGHARRAGELAREARSHLPNDPEVHEALATAAAAEGALEAAVESLDAAATAYEREGDREAAGRALERAASLAERAGRASAAEDRLARAIAYEASGHRWAKLATLRWQLGAEDSADRAADETMAQLDSAAPGSLESTSREVLLQVCRRALQAGRRDRARRGLRLLTRLAPDDAARGEIATDLEAAEREAWREAPARLLSLPPEDAVKRLEEAPDLEAVVERIAASAPEDLLAAVPSWLAVARSSALLEALAKHVDIQDPATLLELSKRNEGETRSSFAERALDALDAREAAGPETGALRALARGLIGSARRDTAALRASLAEAERAGADDVARAIVGLALDVVGEGPARAALLSVLRRLETSVDTPPED